MHLSHTQRSGLCTQKNRSKARGNCNTQKTTEKVCRILQLMVISKNIFIPHFALKWLPLLFVRLGKSQAERFLWPNTSKSIFFFWTSNTTQVPERLTARPGYDKSIVIVGAIGRSTMKVHARTVQTSSSNIFPITTQTGRAATAILYLTMQRNCQASQSGCGLVCFLHVKVAQHPYCSDRPYCGSTMVIMRWLLSVIAVRRLGMIMKMKKIVAPWTTTFT